ncbi:drug/metabolite transporter (DMT)-like permease [Bacillus niacini]|uniref:Drug/metabolite transporter (DMT)-like permease n=1 Tax=Neobacillus niacini TaxID=86668 RepID=A0A852TN99_9BACI|nr:DMT family transporter [Neobacillus niacini]NYE09136.1 drug/metabolite transporter (DMT)-like permease [Neobacillus niacini]
MARLYGALFTLSLIWGTSFLFIKLLVEPLGAWGVVFGRCLFGTVILLLIIVLRKDWKGLKGLPFGIIVLVSLLNNALPWYLIALSETKITSSYASLINATTPIWTLIIGFLFFQNKLRLLQWLGIALGFFGIIILSGVDITSIKDQSIVGLFTMVGATLCYGYSTHLTKKYLSTVSVTMISFSTLIVSALISFIMVLLTDRTIFTMILEPSIFGALVGLGVFGSGIAYLLYYYCIQKGSPEFASLVTYLVPISAMVWGAVILKEEIHFSMITGFILILAGVYVSSKKPKENRIQISKTA